MSKSRILLVMVIFAVLCCGCQNNALKATIDEQQGAINELDTRVKTLEDKLNLMQKELNNYKKQLDETQKNIKKTPYTEGNVQEGL